MCYTLLKYMAENNRTKSSQKSTKQRVLLPSLKERQRYIVYRIIMPNQLRELMITSKNSINLGDQIISQCSSTIGLFDSANAGIVSVKYNPHNVLGIIRVNNDYADKLKTSLALINNLEIDGKKCHAAVDCLYISGLLNKANNILKNAR